MLITSHTPTEGSSRSLITALLDGLRAGVVFGLLFGLLLGATRHGLLIALLVGLGAGLPTGMNNGGWFVLLQKSAHRRLAQAGKFPLRSGEFLEWGIEMRIFRRVGGGVRFRHNLIQQHLANPPASVAGAQDGTEGSQERSNWWREPVDKLPWWQYALAILMAYLSLRLTRGGGPLNAPLFKIVPPSLDSYALLGLTFSLAVPGIFGFWVGLKSRTLRLWDRLLPWAAIVGLAEALALARPTIARHAGFTLQEELITHVLYSLIPVLTVAVSGALLGRARQHKAIAAQTGVTPRATPDAAIGFAGALIAALINLMTWYVNQAMANGG